MRCIYLLFIILLLTTSASAEIERRAAIDMGSGSTKLAIADVEVESKRIVELIYEQAFPVPFQASLDKSDDGTFDAETKAQALEVFSEINQLAETHQVQRIAAVATSAFRKANNAKEFVSEIEKQTQIKVSVIPQHEEGEIAFFSALTTGEFTSEEIVVWDIGTGSLQITTQNDAQGLTVYMGEQMGSVAFKSYIVDVIQEKEAQSPNPMSDADFDQADRYARAFGRHAYPLIKQKIQKGGPVIGIGRLFYNSLRPIAAEEGIINRTNLRHFILASLEKSDQELNNLYAHVDVSNAILTLAIMKALHIHEILPVETTTTKGMLVHPSYW